MKKKYSTLGDEILEIDLTKIQPAQTSAQKVSELFTQLRHDPNHHLGLGDIRLTIGQQEEIIAILNHTTQYEKD